MDLKLLFRRVDILRNHMLHEKIAPNNLKSNVISGILDFHFRFEIRLNRPQIYNQKGRFTKKQHATRENHSKLNGK
jgi:hypothetical protein